MKENTKMKEAIKMESVLLVNLEELCRMLSCGRRNAEKIGQLAKAEVRIGRIRRWHVQKLKEFLEQEAR